MTQSETARDRSPVPLEEDELLTPAEVARLFRVNPKTVTRWARSGKIQAIRTLGGHRRFRASDIRHFLEQGS
ncbi:MAG: helix-turn-helix domain-containing protein [Acidimicrobiia bacterium]|nr:helix-turn-helix domain-containing protein [Acidimicrobiia bacterium]